MYNTRASKQAGATTGVLAALAGVVVVVVTIVPVMLFRQMSAVPATTDRLPARIEYELHYEDGVTPGLTKGEFVLELESWTSWRLVQTCCGEYAGYTQVWQDGTMHSGYPTWKSGLLITHRGEPGDLAVPGPDFSQGRPMNEGEARAFPGIEVDAASAEEHARRLGIDVNEVFAYRANALLGVDGLPLESSTEPLQATEVRSLYVLHRTLRIPIFVEEMTDGRVTRILVVTLIEPLDL